MRSPYRGLAPFLEEDAKSFAGRDQQIQILYDNLRANRVTTIFGESGIGKTSLVGAGLMPQFVEAAQRQLEDGEDPEFLCVLIREWKNPSSRLLTTAAERLNRDAPSEVSLAGGLAALQFSGRWAIILDQFEEAFDEQIKAQTIAFLKELKRAIWHPKLRINLLISIREDMLSLLDNIKPELPEAFDNLIQIQGLTIDQAVEAMRKPLEDVANGPNRIESEEVAKQVARDVLALRKSAKTIRPADLQIVLETWWEKDKDKKNPAMLWKTIEDLGGVAKISAAYFREKVDPEKPDPEKPALNPAERDRAEKIFEHLVSPSGRKQPQSIADLGGEPVEELLEKLTTEMRILTGTPIEGGERGYQFAHDVLAKASSEWRKDRQTKRQLANLKKRFLGFTAAAAVIAAAVVFLVWKSNDSRTAERLLANLSDSPFLRSEQDIWPIAIASSSVKTKILDRILSVPRDAERFATHTEALVVAIGGVSPGHLEDLANEVIADRCVTRSKLASELIDACLESLSHFGSWANQRSARALSAFAQAGDATSKLPDKALAELSGSLPQKDREEIFVKFLDNDASSDSIHALASRVSPGLREKQFERVLKEKKVDDRIVDILAQYVPEDKVTLGLETLQPGSDRDDAYIVSLLPHVSRQKAANAAQDTFQLCLTTVTCHQTIFEEASKRLTDLEVEKLVGDLLVALGKTDKREMAIELLSSLAPRIAGGDLAIRVAALLEKT
ncbi:MAG TPA: hypothetical protein VEX68_11355, partial [Bryobacteraceae bacterium]|nr:hypothetical protein [Bryobacteraceae bacterium]